MCAAAQLPWPGNQPDIVGNEPKRLTLGGTVRGVRLRAKFERAQTVLMISKLLFVIFQNAD